MEIGLSDLLPSSPGAFHPIDGRGCGILSGGRKQLSPLEKSHRPLHRGLRQSRALRQLPMTQRRDPMARTHASPPQMEVDKKCRGAPFMLGEIAHQHIENVTIQGNLQN